MTDPTERPLARLSRFVRGSLRTRFARDAGVLAGGQLLVSVLAFIQGLVVAAWLGPESYGVALLIMSVPEMTFAILDARTSAAAVRYLTEFRAAGAPERARALCKLAYSVDLGIAVLLLLLVTAVAGWAEHRVVHREGTAGLMIVYAAAYLPRALTGTSQSVLTVLGRFRALAIAQLAAKAVGVIAVLALVLRGHGVQGVIWGRMAELVVTGIVLGVLAAGAIRATWSGSWLGARYRELSGRFREIFRFLGFTELTELVHLVVKQADVVLLGAFAGPVEAGFFGLARRMTGIVSTVVQPLESVLYPRLAARWAERDLAGLRRSVRRFALAVCLPLAGGVLLAIPLVPPFLHHLVSPDYDPGVPAVQVYFAATAVWVATFWLRPLFHAMGEVRFVFLNALVLNLVSLVGFLLLAKPLGALGVSLVHVVVGGLGANTAALLYARSRLRGRTEG